MRTIDADELISRVRQSKNNNSHIDPRVRNNHYSEHEHFIEMIKWMPTIETNKEEVGQTATTTVLGENILKIDL